MSLSDFVPLIPEIFLAAAGFAILLAGISLGLRGVRTIISAAVASLGVTAV